MPAIRGRIPVNLSSVCRNELGFLLVEHLIALIIVGVLMQVCFCVVKLNEVYDFNADQVSVMDIQMAANQLQIDSRDMLKLTSSTDKLHLQMESGSIVTYRISDGKLLRQVDGLGGEVLLYHCQNLLVELFDEQSGYLYLTTSSQQTYPIYITTFHNLAILPVATIDEVLIEDERLESEEEDEILISDEIFETEEDEQPVEENEDSDTETDCYPPLEETFEEDTDLVEEPLLPSYDKPLIESNDWLENEEEPPIETKP